MSRSASPTAIASSPPVSPPLDRTHRPHKRTLTSSSAASGVSPRPATRRESTSMSSVTGFTAGSDWDEEWEGGEEVRARRRRRKDEPMSSVAVVFYVISLYLVFQILTRSDDHEILSHLPGPLRPSNYLLDPQQPYHLPYHLPHLPSPLPSSSSSSRSDTTTTSTFRVFLGILVYPVYVLITLLATPLPLLLNGLSLLLLVLNAVLYPFTSTLRFLTRTILLGPLAMFVRVAEALYPVSTFVAGVVGVGCVMGAGAGYAGRAVVDLLLGGKKRSKRIKRSKSGRQSILADRSEKDVGEKKGRSTISPSTESSGQVPTIPAAVHSKLFSESRSRKVRTGTGESERDWRDGKAGKEGRDGEAMGVRRRTSHLGR